MVMYGILDDLFLVHCPLGVYSCCLLRLILMFPVRFFFPLSFPILYCLCFTSHVMVKCGWLRSRYCCFETLISNMMACIIYNVPCRKVCPSRNLASRIQQMSSVLSSSAAISKRKRSSCVSAVIEPATPPVVGSPVDTAVGPVPSAKKCAWVSARTHVVSNVSMYASLFVLAVNPILCHLLPSLFHSENLLQLCLLQVVLRLKPFLLCLSC